MWKHEYNTTGGKCQTAGPGRPVSTTNSGNLQISLEPGQKPHCHRIYGQTPEPKCPAGEKTTWLSLALENPGMEVTTRNLGLSRKNLKRIQTMRCMVPFGCYYKALERACCPEAWALRREAVLGKRSGWPPEVPRPSVLALVCLLVKTEAFWFLWIDVIYHP